MRALFQLIDARCGGVELGTAEKEWLRCGVVESARSQLVSEQSYSSEELRSVDELALLLLAAINHVRPADTTRMPLHGAEQLNEAAAQLHAASHKLRSLRRLIETERSQLKQQIQVLVELETVATQLDCQLEAIESTPNYPLFGLQSPTDLALPLIPSTSNTQSNTQSFTQSSQLSTSQLANQSHSQLSSQIATSELTGVDGYIAAYVLGQASDSRIDALLDDAETLSLVKQTIAFADDINGVRKLAVAALGTLTDVIR